MAVDAKKHKKVPDIKDDIFHLASQSKSRMDFWIGFIDRFAVKKMVEIGVYRGEFAESALRKCAGIEKYLMLDPWRHLDAWNKPANTNNDEFEKYYRETLDRTDFVKEKRAILRGKTTEVISQIADHSLDLAYIDGDHTLKGITIDLINIYPKVKDGGFLGGDDFSETIWQHPVDFEPTLIFPFAVYFAEAMGDRIFSLSHNQFLIQKSAERNYEFIDLAGIYNDVTLKNQFIKKS